MMKAKLYLILEIREEGITMLTKTEVKNTRNELQQNFDRLGYEKDRICREAEISPAALDAALQMNNPVPNDVWKVRDYLEDMLVKEGKEVYPWTRLADHSANRWFDYDTPWRR